MIFSDIYFCVKKRGSDHQLLTKTVQSITNRSRINRAQAVTDDIAEQAVAAIRENNEKEKVRRTSRSMKMVKLVISLFTHSIENNDSSETIDVLRCAPSEYGSELRV